MLWLHWELLFWCFLTSDYLSLHDHLLSVLLLLLSSVILLYSVTRRIKLVPSTSLMWLSFISFGFQQPPFPNYRDKETNLGNIKFTGKISISFSEARFHSTILISFQAELQHPAPQSLNIFFVQTLLLLCFFCLGLVWFFFQWRNWRELDSTLVQWHNAHIVFYYNL